MKVTEELGGGGGGNMEEEKPDGERRKRRFFALSPNLTPQSLCAVPTIWNEQATYWLYKPMSGNGLKRGRGIAKKGKEGNLEYAYSLKRHEGIEFLSLRWLEPAQ